MKEPSIDALFKHKVMCTHCPLILTSDAWWFAGLDQDANITNQGSNSTFLITLPTEHAFSLLFSLQEFC